MKVILTESQLKHIIREAVLAEHDPDEWEDQWEPYSKYEFSADDFIESIAEAYSDPSYVGDYTEEENPKAYEFLTSHGIDATNREEVKEFLKELLNEFISKHYYKDGFEVIRSNERPRYVIDYCGLDGAVDSLCEDYPAIFDDKEFIMQDVLGKFY